MGGVVFDQSVSRFSTTNTHRDSDDGYVAVHSLISIVLQLIFAPRTKCTRAEATRHTAAGNLGHGPSPHFHRQRRPTDVGRVRFGRYSVDGA